MYQKRGFQYFAFALVAGLLILSTVNAEAATSGGKCSKLGKTQISKGITHKCVKAGKSLKLNRVTNKTVASTTIATTVIALPKEDDMCSKVGAQLALSESYLECRTISGGETRWFELKSSPPAITVPTGSAALETCELREARINKYQPWNVGFPRGASGTPMLSSSGVSNVQLIAVDFSDAFGTANELSAAEVQIAEFNKWFSFTSNGTKSFKWQFSKQWLRMSKAVSSYALKKGDRATVIPMAQEIVSLADPLIDFSHSDFVFVLFPKSIRLGVPDLGMANWRVESAEGPVINLFGGAEYFYDNNYDLWSFWVHEWGHPMGLASHSPHSNLSMMGNQNGNSVTLNVWDTFLSGWLGSDQLFCLPPATTSFETQLIPLERLQHGIRGIVVPLSNTNALVIESHRAEGWGAGLGVGTYGVLVYYIDTTKDTDRSGESIGLVKETWAEYITPAVTNKHKLLVRGDSVTYKGITVAVTKSGDVDTVRITR